MRPNNSRFLPYRNRALGVMVDHYIYNHLLESPSFSLKTPNFSLETHNYYWRTPAFHWDPRFCCRHPDFIGDPNKVIGDFLSDFFWDPQIWRHSDRVFHKMKIFLRKICIIFAQNICSRIFLHEAQKFCAIFFAQNIIFYANKLFLNKLTKIDSFSPESNNIQIKFWLCYSELVTLVTKTLNA